MSSTSMGGMASVDVRKAVINPVVIAVSVVITFQAPSSPPQAVSTLFSLGLWPSSSSPIHPHRIHPYENRPTALLPGLTVPLPSPPTMSTYHPRGALAPWCFHPESQQLATSQLATVIRGLGPVPNFPGWKTSSHPLPLSPRYQSGSLPLVHRRLPLHQQNIGRISPPP
ncbi:hypothetical protein EI94DRAFT_1808564 [Lactarius quietus]|nr:hypothetical protein EI94DRAFT_1808564 [Lactarius quietus]